MKEEFYSPGSIRYTKSQVLWLLKNVMDGDTWPPDHRETGYTGDPKKKGGRHAPYEMTKMVVGELAARLERCGEDGLALEFITRLSDGDDAYLIGRVAHYQRRQSEDVQQGITLALRYCSGFRGKQISYGRWCFYCRLQATNKGRRSVSPPAV